MDYIGMDGGGSFFGWLIFLAIFGVVSLLNRKQQQQRRKQEELRRQQQVKAAARQLHERTRGQLVDDGIPVAKPRARGTQSPPSVTTVAPQVPQPPPVLQPIPEENATITMRDLMDAFLGMPTQARPRQVPPAVAPPTQTPHARSTQATRQSQRQPSPSPSLPQSSRQNRSLEAPVRPARSLEEAASTRQAKTLEAPTASHVARQPGPEQKKRSPRPIAVESPSRALRLLLSDRRGLRQAILASELLGPPIALRDNMERYF